VDNQVRDRNCVALIEKMEAMDNKIPLAATEKIKTLG
jgi:hypothetical protein